MTSRARWVISGALLVGACACTSGPDGGSEEPRPGAAAVDVGDLVLDGPVDAVIRMQPAGPGKPPDFLTAGNTLLSARRQLIAPGGSDGPSELWIVRMKQPNGAVQLCRFVTNTSGGGGTCVDAGQAPAGLGGEAVVQIGASSDGSEVLYDLSGPDDLTHYVLALGGRRVAVIPIEGEAVVAFADGCGDIAEIGTVTAWRGDVQVDQQPLSAPC